MIKTLKKNKFIKAVSILSSGVLIAQILMVFTIPLLTRLYTPLDYERLTIFVGITLLLSGLSTGRFEVAIPKKNELNEVINLVHLSLSLNMVFSILYFIIYIVVSLFWELERYWILIPICSFFVGLYNIFYYWALYREKFSDISKTRVSQVVSSNLISIFLGYLGVNVGLLIGHIVNFAMGFMRLSKEYIFNFKKYQNKINLKKTFYNNSNYIKFSTPEYIFQNISYYLPLIYLTTLAPLVVGYIFLLTKIINIPLNLVGRSISNIFYLNTKSKDNYFKYFIKSYLWGGVVSSSLIGFLCIVLYYFSALIFGENWAGINDILWLMLPIGIGQFLTSTYSTIFYNLHKEKVLMFISIFGFFFRILPFLFFKENIVNYFLIFNAIFYISFSILIVLLVYRWNFFQIK